MPELPEVERYRQLAEKAGLDRLITSVRTPDLWYLKRGSEPEAIGATLLGRRFVSARRRGKLMMLDTDDGTVLGLRFGMSGRLVADDLPAVDQLLYGRTAADPRFERFALQFDDGGALVMSDPRRLGGVELDPDEDRLGPDALGIALPALRRALQGGDTPLKARLLDQKHIAGVGNLIADEVLWRAGLSPLRRAGDLNPSTVRRLHLHLTTGLADLIGRGGSHMGDLMAERRPGGLCPRDGTPLVRATVGGRTTWWCPKHQR